MKQNKALQVLFDNRVVRIMLMLQKKCYKKSLKVRFDNRVLNETK